MSSLRISIGQQPAINLDTPIRNIPKETTTLDLNKFY